MSNSFVQFDLRELLSPEEQELFAANARRRGRKPAQHFKDLAFGAALTAAAEKAAPGREPEAREEAEFAAAGAGAMGMVMGRSTEGHGARPLAPAVRITAIRASIRKKEGGAR